MTDYSGRHLGNYRLLRLIGQGGFAAVYLGEHVRLGMKAALKLLHTHLSAPGDIDLFQQEARTIAELRHPHIVRVLDFDVQQGQPFLVLDYAPGGSLQQRHSRGVPVPPPLVAHYVTQMAAALQYAHDRRLIHRDVKPANMLIGEQDTLLLSDFGIATIAHATSSLRTESSLGTLAYMAPEQLHGKSRPASDQYALAISAYLWLTGNLPFQGSSTEVIGQQLSAPPPSMRAQVTTLSAGIEQVVMKALAKDPARRFERVQDFAQALEQSSQALNQLVYAPTRIEPARSAQPLRSQGPTPPLQETPPAPVSPDKLFLPGRVERNERPAMAAAQQLAAPPGAVPRLMRDVSEPASTEQPAIPAAATAPTRGGWRLLFWLWLTTLLVLNALLYYFLQRVSNQEVLPLFFQINSAYCLLLGLLIARRRARLGRALLLCALSEVFTIALCLLATNVYGDYQVPNVISAAPYLLLLNAGCSLLGCLLGWRLDRRRRQQSQPVKKTAKKRP